jgi:hypothetical protein
LALHAAAARGDSHSVAQLLQSGALVDQRDSAEQTACHVAVRCQHARVVALLLRADCNVNAVDDKDRTPCHLAVLGGNQDLVAMLLAVGAQVHRFRDTNQNTIDLAHSDVLARTVLSGRSNGDVDAINCERDEVLRVCQARSWPTPTRQQVRALVASGRTALARYRAFDVCVGLHRLRLDALCMCHILQADSDGDAQPFHFLWALAVAVKHFCRRRKERG